MAALMCGPLSCDNLEARNLTLRRPIPIETLCRPGRLALCNGEHAVSVRCGQHEDRFNRKNTLGFYLCEERVGFTVVARLLSKHCKKATSGEAKVGI